MSFFDEEYYDDLRYGDVDPELSALNRERRDARWRRMERARAEPISQKLAVKLIRDYQGRALKGWCMVEWNNEFFYPKKAVAEWVRSNVADEDVHQCSIGPRYFFRHETDAVLCYLAFK